MIELRRINDAIVIGLLDLGAFGASENIESKRELEKKGTAYLLENLLKNSRFELEYTAEKKPFLKHRNEHISISHSHEKLAVIVNTKESTGIDIELIRDKVLNIRHKFLSEKELLFAGSDVEKLITCWAAKEAMYKVYGLREVDFSRHLLLEDFNGVEMRGSLNLGSINRNFRLINETIDGYKMVYVLNEI